MYLKNLRCEPGTSLSGGGFNINNVILKIQF
jgi:hypothetical protein